MISTNEIADQLWQSVRQQRTTALNASETASLIDQLRMNRDRDTLLAAPSDVLLLEVHWRTERIPVPLCTHHSFTTLCASLFAHLVLCSERAELTAADLREGMREFCAISAADADVCVVAPDGGLIGGLSVVAHEMTPAQVHAQLLDEGVDFRYVWQIVDSTIASGGSGAGSGAGSAVEGPDDDGDDLSITPRRESLLDDGITSPDVTSLSVPNRGISSRLLLAPPPGTDARRLSKTKTRKRRVRKNTATSTNSSRSSSITSMSMRADGSDSPGTPTLRDSVGGELTQSTSAVARVASTSSSSSNDAKRRGVIDELLATEQEFVSDLYMLNAHFAAPLAADKIAGRRKLGKTLFQNIPELLALHATLLVRLRRAAQICPPAIASAISAWLAASDVCEPHATYAGGFQRALSLIEGARAQPPQTDLPRSPLVDEAVTAIGGTLLTDGGSLCAFVGRPATVANGSVALLPRDLSDSKALQGVAAYVRLNESMQTMRKETFESFLIRPIQRLMRYPLLLRALLSATPLDEPDHSRLCVVIERIEEIVESVNRSKAMHETEDKLAELSRTVAGLEKFKPEGFLLKGTFTEVAADTQSQPPQQQQWLLFENVLVRCVPTPPQQSGGKSWKALDALATARLWVSGEHHDALAAASMSDSVTPVARRTLARQAGLLVFGEALDDGESEPDDEAAPLSPHSDSSPSSPGGGGGGGGGGGAASVTTSSTVIDTFGEKVTQVGRKLVVRARTPLDARQWARTVESATRRLALRVAPDRRALFFAAACDGDLATVRRALRKAPALWSATLEETGGSVLHALCDVAAPSEAQLGVARFFVRCNANLLLADNNDSIALRSALIRSRGELARLLLPVSSLALDARRFARRRLVNVHTIGDFARVPVDARHFGASTLHLLVVGGEPLRRLLSAAVLSVNEAKAASRALDGDGRSPLSLAIALRDARTVRLLLRARAPVHGIDHVGCEIDDGATLGEEQAELVFAPRPSDAALVPAAGGAVSAPSLAPDSAPSTPTAVSATPDEPIEATDNVAGSAALFAEQLGCGELAHAIVRAAHFLKGKPSDVAPFPSSIVSPRESPVTPTRLNRAALTMSSRQSARQADSSETDERALAQSSRSSRTSAGGTPGVLIRKQHASAATVSRRVASPQ
jgi:hypothetical protein